VRESLRDYEHLLRLGLLFAGGFVVFLILRALLVPEGFGEIGHYRVGAIEDNRVHAVKFAGAAACLDCHPDAGEAKAQAAHAGVRCEACHGALAAHASDPSANPAERPEASTLCAVCHTRNVAKPQGFPQVDPVEHAEGMSCIDCHDAHRPNVG
jgi:hypothetical protein